MWQEHWLFTDLGTDLTPIKLRFDATTHESKSDEEKYRPIQELITLANQTPVDRFVEVIGPRFDIPGFIRFVAAQAYLGDTDGFLGAFGMNNFYLYRLENQDPARADRVGHRQHVLGPDVPDQAADTTC